MIAWVSLGIASIFLCWFDIREHRLPNRVVATAFVIGVVTFIWDTDKFPRAFVTAVGLLLSYGAVHALTRGGVGLGDVKLAGVIGLYLGNLDWRLVISATWLAFALAGIYGLLGVMTKRITMKTRIAFGPFMLAGMWLSVVFGGGN